VADDQIEPAEAVRAYHNDLAKLGIRPHRPLEEDLQRTETAFAYGERGSGGAGRGRSPSASSAPPKTASGPGSSQEEPDFRSMTPAEKARWNLERWKRILG